jgi:predicted MPP superfamily phosphohydrolase
MNKKISFMLYFLLFLLVYISLNFYVVIRLGGYLGIEKNILYLLIILINFSLPISMYMERIFPNILSKIFYTISTFWLGILLFALCLLLIYEIISLFWTTSYAGIIIITGIAILSIASAVNASKITIKEVNIPIKNLKKNINIVQLSDIHIGTIRNSNFLKKIIKKTSQLNPDMIIITGDMVDASSRLNKEMFKDFNKFKSPIYFITGNHEVIENTEKTYSFLEETNIQILKNEIISFENVQIIGIEFSEDKNHLEEKLKKINIDKSKPSILIYHSPEGYNEAKKLGINLQLAGHTHSGQIFPFNFIVKIKYKYIKGLYDLGNMFLYVSPGTGTWGPYMRLGSKNEITLIKLIPG